MRPSPFDIRHEHESYVSTYGFLHSEAQKAKVLAEMDQRLLALEAREQERDRLKDQLGIAEFERQMTAAAEGVVASETELENIEQTPNVIAALLMADLGCECMQEATIAGPNRDGTMRMGAAALEALLPKLSGLIRDHAAFFVANRTTPLSAMPFSAR